MMSRLSESNSSRKSQEREIDNMRRQIEEYQAKQRVLETWLQRQEEDNRAQKIANDRNQQVIDTHRDESTLKDRCKVVKREKRQLEERVRQVESELQASQQKVIEQNRRINEY